MAKTEKKVVEEKTVQIEVLPRRYVSFNDPDWQKADGTFGEHRCLSCAKVTEVGKDGVARLVWAGDQEWVTPTLANKWITSKKRNPADPNEPASPPLVKVLANRSMEVAKAARIALHEGRASVEPTVEPTPIVPVEPVKPAEDEKPKADEPKTADSED